MVCGFCFLGLGAWPVDRPSTARRLEVGLPVAFHTSKRPPPPSSRPAATARPPKLLSSSRLARGAL